MGIMNVIDSFIERNKGKKAFEDGKNYIDHYELAGEDTKDEYENMTDQEKMAYWLKRFINHNEQTDIPHAAAVSEHFRKLSEQENVSEEDTEEDIRSRYQNMTEQEKMDYWLERFVNHNEQTGSPAANATSKHFNKSIILSDKIDDFIEWYEESFEDADDSTKLRNFIEKMAIWYELRYPDYEVNRLLPCIDEETTEINDVMFKNNDYINDLFFDTEKFEKLDWNEFYNINAFINSLPFKERSLFFKPEYSRLVFIDPSYDSAHLHLNTDGIVEESEGFGPFTRFKIRDTYLEGMHITDVVKLLKEDGFVLPSNNELEKTIKGVEKKTYQQEEILNCVMYRIIERGGNRIGPRRAFLFAKEFKRDIDIPMMYGIDTTDPGLRIFINEYIKSGGSKDLVCYGNYFSINEELYNCRIGDLIKKYTKSGYTYEEKQLYQRFASILASQVDDKETKEEVQELKLEKKLEKNKI